MITSNIMRYVVKEETEEERIRREAEAREKDVWKDDEEVEIINEEDWN